MTSASRPRRPIPSLGDTLWSIAEKNGYTVAELRTANPAVANTDNLSVGMELSLMRPQKLLNVSSERVIEVTETLTHETQTIMDDSMYSDQTVVRQKGSDGERKSTIQINYVNGAEVSRETLSQVVTVEPVTEIIVKGTQKRPSNVSARGYLRPVNGGTITSGFGRRNRPTAGASSYHYGVDIGVGYGTPSWPPAPDASLRRLERRLRLYGADRSRRRRRHKIRPLLTRARLHRAVRLAGRADRPRRLHRRVHRNHPAL